MKRRLLAALLLAVMLVTALPLYLIPVSAADTFIEKDFTSRISWGGAYRVSELPTTKSTATEDGMAYARFKFTKTISKSSDRALGPHFILTDGETNLNDAKFVTIKYRYTMGAEANTAARQTWQPEGTNWYLLVVKEDGTTITTSGNYNTTKSSNGLVWGEWAYFNFDLSAIAEDTVIKELRLIPYKPTGSNSGYPTGTYARSSHTGARNDRICFVSDDKIDIGTVYYSTTGFYTGEPEEPEVTKYTVTAVADDVTVDTAEVEEGANYTLPAAPAKEGYIFTGWSDGTNTYAAGAQVAITANTTFIAVFEEITENPNPDPEPVTKYTVTAKVDDTTVDTAEIEEGASYTLPAAQVKDGYNFVGWSDGTNTYAAGAEVTITADTTFTAIFSAKVYYNVTVISDGNTVASVAVEENTKYTLPAAQVKDGYNFVGWTDGTNTYAAGAEVTITGATAFEAVFTAKAYYTVTIVSDGATVSTEQVEENTKYTLPAAPAKDGYNFKGWSDGATVHEAGASVTVIGNTTFTAVFEEKSPVTTVGNFIVKNYTEEVLIADTNKGYSPTNKIDNNVDKSAPVKATVTRTTASTRAVAKLTFDSVGNNKGTGISFYIPEGEITTEQAKYVSIQYKYTSNDATINNVGSKMTLRVTLENGNTTYVQSSNTMVAGEWATVTFNISSIAVSDDIKSFHLYPYTFSSGYTYGSTPKDGAKKQVNYVAGDTIHLGSFFFSSDEDNKYKTTTTFTFYNNSFKEEVINTVSSVLGVITIPTAEEKEGYTFKGWVDDAGNTYVEGSTIYTYEDVEIYANYRPNDAADDEFRVAFNNNGGEGEEIEPFYASSVTMPAGPVILGYTFTGWTDGTNTYAVGETVAITKDTVFTAIFVETYYTVTIISDGKTIDEISVREGAIFKLPAPAVKEGCTFVGWTDGKESYSSGAEVMIVGNTTFTAIFQEGVIDRDIKAETIRAIDNSYKNPMKLTDGAFSAGSGGYLTVSSSNTGAMTAFTDANGKQGVTIAKSSGGGTAVIFQVPSSSSYPTKSLLSFDLYFDELPTYEDGKVGIFSDRERNTMWDYSVDTSWLHIWTDENGKSWIGMANCDTPQPITTGKWYTAAFFIPGTTSNQKTEKLNGWIKAEDDHTYRAIGTLTNCSFVGNSNRATFAFVRNDVIDFTVSDFVMTLKSDTNFVKVDGVQFSKVENGVYSVRFVAALDGLATGETKLGFDVVCESQGKSWNRETDKVYKSILANFGHDKITAEELGASYITTLALNNIPASVGELELVCTPYVVINNVKFYGTAVTVKCIPEGSNYSFAVVETTGETTLPVTVEGGKVTIKKTIDGLETAETLEPGTHELVLTNDAEVASHTYDFKVSGAGVCTFGTPETNGRVVKKDGIIVEFNARSEGKHASFTIYLPTSDPSGKYYIGYNMEYQSIANVSEGNAGANSNLYRVYGAGLYYVSYWDGVTLKATNKLEVLQSGEISLALLEYDGVDYANKADDYIGGLHGDERLLDPTKARLFLDGVEIDLDAAMSHKYVTCSYITFEQETTMFRYGTATTSSYGEAVATHNQYFRIDESGFRNDQSLTWLVDTFYVRENFMQMFTMKRLDGYWQKVDGEQTYHYGDVVCESFRVYDGNDNVLWEETIPDGWFEGREQRCVNTKNRRVEYWSEISGVSGYAGFSLPDDNMRVVNSYVFLRENYSKGDNKWYVSIKARENGDNPQIGDVWTISNYYGIDYDSRTIVK